MTTPDGPLGLGATLRWAARQFSDTPAVVAPDGQRLTYRELDRASDEVAAGLARRNIGRGDVVALALPSSAEYLIAYLAAAKRGAVTAGVNPRLAPAERARITDTAAPALVVGTAELLDGTTPPGHVVEVELDGLRGLRAPFEEEPAGPSDGGHPGDPVAIVFTSGTTGAPKGAVFTQGHLDAIRRIDVGDPPYAPGAPLLVSTELVHVGVMTKLAWYLRLGCTLHLLRRWRATDALRVISEQRIPSVGGIAPQIALMLRDPDFDSYDLSAVQTVVAGGAPSPPALVAEATQRFGAAYSIRYSSTESGGVGTGTAFDADDEEALHTVGRPRPGVEVRIAGGGEVQLRSPAVMRGYWRDDAATTAAFTEDGWLRTGDLGEIDDRGCLRLLGRRDDVYIRGGYNVHPETVEAALRQHPAVADVAVVGRPDAVLGSIGVAVVVPKGSAPPDLDSLRTFAENDLAHHELPEALVLADELPRNAVHKLDRRALLKSVEGSSELN